MKTKKDIEKDLFKFFNGLFAADRKTFGFFYDESNPTKAGECYVIQRQNQAIRPADKTMLYYRIDNYEDWGNRKAGTGHYYNGKGKEVITQLKTFECVVNIYSKERGMAYDASNFLVAMAESTRYDDLTNYGTIFLRLKDVGEPKDLTYLENSTWVERIETRFVFNFVNEVENSDVQYSVHKPSTLGDVVNSVDYTNTIKEGLNNE